MSTMADRRARLLRPAAFAALVGAALFAASQMSAVRAHAAPRSGGDSAGNVAPAFTHTRPEDWLNSAPLELAKLRGNVVLLDVWTTDCWNCYRSFPWLHEIEHRYAVHGVRIVGVLSPEFEREKDPVRIRARLAEYGVEQPVMLDNDYSYWNALGNRFWPAFYLIDKQGHIRVRLVGEQHAGDPSARKFEDQLKALSAE
jgi:thiol-disulfide isomerase/thioredoxin